MEDRDAYWDGGPPKIQAFLDQHEPACKNNWICTRLQLAGLVVQHTGGEMGGRKSTDDQKSRHKISYLLEDST
jgi:hypothetical protein